MHVDKTVENIKQCMCFKCPSYTPICKAKNWSDISFLGENISKHSHYEMMFCAFEKSNCIHENRGCLCVKCPVHQKYELNNEDYCLKTGGVL